MTDRSRHIRPFAGATTLVAVLVTALSTLLTWIHGVSYCGLTHLIVVQSDLWQLGLPVRGSWYSLALFFVIGGAFVLALVGVNELGIPVLRWLDRWRWAPGLLGTALIGFAALDSHGDAASTGRGLTACGYSFTTGPGRWVCLAGAAVGAIGTLAIAAERGWANHASAEVPISALARGRRT